MESFLSDSAGRDGILEGELALDARGKFLALRMRVHVGLGAYTTQYAAIFSTMNTRNCLSSVYRIPRIAIDVKMVLTNTAPLGPYRGAGRPEAIYLIERLIDGAARHMGSTACRCGGATSFRPKRCRTGRRTDRSTTPASSRPRWTRRSRCPTGKVLPGAARRRAQRQAARHRHVLLPRGRGRHLNEKADLRFEAGRAAIRLGVQAMGQGHLSTLPRIVAKTARDRCRDVKLIEGDSDEVPDGTPSVASRSLMMAGSASAIACDTAIEKGRRIASQIFEVAAGDIEFSGGIYRGRRHRPEDADPGAGAARATLPNLPDDLKNGSTRWASSSRRRCRFRTAVMCARSRSIRDTGAVAVVGYVAVDDVGTIIHAVIVDGQTHGGIAQGLGRCWRQVVYGADGQLINASFMDYVMPRATDIPQLATGTTACRCATNPIGVKGAGESASQARCRRR
jgi:carbon-monoxide dehydrogenase large subunit